MGGGRSDVVQQSNNVGQAQILLSVAEEKVTGEEVGVEKALKENMKEEIEFKG